MPPCLQPPPPVSCISCSAVPPESSFHVAKPLQSNCNHKHNHRPSTSTEASRQLYIPLTQPVCPSDLDRHGSSQHHALTVPITHSPCNTTTHHPPPSLAPRATSRPSTSPPPSPPPPRLPHPPSPVYRCCCLVLVRVEARELCVTSAGCDQSAWGCVQHQTLYLRIGGY